MFEEKYSKTLTIVMVAAIILIVVGLGAAFLFMGRNKKIKQDASDAVAQYQAKINGIIEEEEKSKNENKISKNEIANEDNGQMEGSDYLERLRQQQEQNNNKSNSNGNSSQSSGNNQATYKGFPMAGTIKIPAINVEYPVLESISKAGIEVAVAVDYGPGLNQVGNTVIVGHNYKDTTFFSDNKKLKEGDKIYVTDEVTKSTVTYTIYNMYITSPEDTEYYTRDTGGKREISLSTCTDDVKSRLIIWAKE